MHHCSLWGLPEQGRPFDVDGWRGSQEEERGGHYKNYEYLITLNVLGHRCGYVAVLPQHKANENLEDLDLHCHGGITFKGNDLWAKKLLSVPCSDNWIGFDCGHYVDMPDYEALKKYFPLCKFLEERERAYRFCWGIDGVSTIKNYDYVEQQCKGLIDQLIEMEAV